VWACVRQCSGAPYIRSQSPTCPHANPSIPIPHLPIPSAIRNPFPSRPHPTRIPIPTSHPVRRIGSGCQGSGSLERRRRSPGPAPTTCTRRQTSRASVPSCRRRRVRRSRPPHSCRRRGGKGRETVRAVRARARSRAICERASGVVRLPCVGRVWLRGLELWQEAARAPARPAVLQRVQRMVALAAVELTKHPDPKCLRSRPRCAGLHATDRSASSWARLLQPLTSAAN
jgi:hypothetical protein